MYIYIYIHIYVYTYSYIHTGIRDAVRALMIERIDFKRPNMRRTRKAPAYVCKYIHIHVYMFVNIGQHHVAVLCLDLWV